MPRAPLHLAADKNVRAPARLRLCRAEAGVSLHLHFLPYYRPCGQSGDYPERQIYQQQVNREQSARPLEARNTPRRSSAGRSQTAPAPEPGSIAGRRGTAAFQAVFIKSPNGIPHSPPQKSGLYISGDFKETGAFTPSAALSPNAKQDVAEKDHGQCAYNPRREADCHPLDHGQTTFHHVQIFFHHVQCTFHHIQPQLSICATFA